jgi:carboxymethylenebutenolidase
MVDALEAALQKTGAPAEIHRYDAAHGFFNERRADVYDANAASLAWDRMMAFFTQHLG